MPLKQNQKTIQKLRVAGLSMAKSHRVAAQRPSAVPKAVVLVGGLGVALLALGGYFALQSPNGSAMQTAAIDAASRDVVDALPAVAVASPSETPVPSRAAAVETKASAQTAPTQPLSADTDPGASQQITPAKAVRQSQAETDAVARPDCVDELAKTAEVFRVGFDVGADVFDPGDREFIRVFGAAVSGCSEAAVIVGGHSDPTGDAGINLQLSWQRADSVVEAWREFGFETDRVEPIGYGSRNL